MRPRAHPCLPSTPPLPVVPPCLHLQGITGSFSGVDASGRFKQATLQLGGGGSSSGSGKPSGGAAVSGPASGAGAGRAGGGRGSSGGGLGFGFGVQQQQPGKAKKKIYDADGAWNGCCFCGVRAKVGMAGGGTSWQACIVLAASADLLVSVGEVLQHLRCLAARKV